MRLSSIIISVCAVVTALASRPAAALSCAGPPWAWQPGSYEREGDFPVDTIWWEQRSCASLERPSGCRLTASGEMIPIEVEVVGEGACSLEEDFGDSAMVIIHYVPGEPLTPGRTYTFDCENEGPWGDVTIGSKPASAPGSLADVEARGIRSDDGCCSFGDYIELTVDAEAAYLKEGGYVEAKYENGQVFALGVEAGDEVMRVPDTRGPLELTPVAADGTRGETRRFEEVPRELVYLPCMVTERPSPLALWLVAPLLWIGAHGRRRRRAGGAS